jgi:hypothetical protein
VVALRDRLVWQELQTQVVAVAVAAMVVTAVQVLLSFLTLAHNEAQAAQSHLAVATLFIHLQPLAHTPLKDNYEQLCKSFKRFGFRSHCG